MQKIKDFYELYAYEENYWHNSNNYLNLFYFYHIKENQLFDKTYFKLGLDSHFKVKRYDVNLAGKYYQGRYINYHMEFV